MYDVSHECRNRCTADRRNLDGGGVRRSHEHTQLLMDTFSVKELWDDHGIVADILVSRFLFYGIILTCTNCARSLLQHPSHVRIFTNSWRQTYFIKLSRVHSKTTSSSGLVSI